MNNPTQGSQTQMVRQSARTFEVQTTKPAPYERFLSMSRAAQAAKQAQEQAEPSPVSPPPVDALPRVRTLAEITAEQRANRAERRRKHEEARQEAEALITPPQSREEALRGTYAPTQAQVTVRRVVTQQTPKPPPAPLPLAARLDLEALRPKRGKGAGGEGAGQLAALIDVLARHALAVRGYACLPSQITMHLSNELIAVALGVPTSTLWRWIKRLEAQGYLHAERHYTTSRGTREQAEQRRSQLARDQAEGRAAPARASRATTTRKRRPAYRDTVCSGTLYAVRLQPGHRARLTIEDYAHEWRDLDADRKAGRTAHAAIKAAQVQADQNTEKNMHGSTTPHAEAHWLDTLKAWAVTPGWTKPPLLNDPCIISDEGPQTVQDVIFTLSLVETAHRDKRPALVGILAATLARCLNDKHSHRHYCRLIWDAYTATIEGRAGLQVLAAQLARIDTDRQEWSELRKPAALLTARMQSA